MNLSFFKPRKYRCDVCCGYEAQNIGEEECEINLKKKNRAREEKEVDKKNAVDGLAYIYTFTMDMQAQLF